MSDSRVDQGSAAEPLSGRGRAKRVCFSGNLSCRDDSRSGRYLPGVPSAVAWDVEQAEAVEGRGSRGQRPDDRLSSAGQCGRLFEQKLRSRAASPSSVSRSTYAQRLLQVNL